MSCPYIKEVVMLFCDAYPVKKMLPLDRLASGHPCLGSFEQCPVFCDAIAKLLPEARLELTADEDAPRQAFRRRP